MACGGADSFRLPGAGPRRRASRPGTCAVVLHVNVGVFPSALRMPPERKSRTRRDRRAGATPGRKARPGSGSTPAKAARSSQRTQPAEPRAAPSAGSAAAAAEEEESRLRQRNRLTLEDDKPAAERCLEQLVFGDVEDDEDALLQRLRSSRVRKACLPARLPACRAGTRSGGARGGRRGPGGGAWRWGGPVAASAQVGGTGDRGRRGAPSGSFASGSGLLAGEGGDAAFLRPKGAAALRIQQALNCRLGLPKDVCKVESLILGLINPQLVPHG